jgi:hypothetical protein
MHHFPEERLQLFLFPDVTMLVGELDEELNKVKCMHCNHKWLDYDKKMWNSRLSFSSIFVPIANSRC